MIVNLMTHPRRFVTVTDLGRYLGVSPFTIYSHIRLQKLAVVHFGRWVRIETDEARRWAELWAYPRQEEMTATHSETQTTL